MSIHPSFRDVQPRSFIGPWTSEMIERMLWARRHALNVASMGCVTNFMAPYPKYEDYERDFPTPDVPVRRRFGESPNSQPAYPRFTDIDLGGHHVSANTDSQRC